MPQPQDKKSFALGYNLKKSAKRFARGGQIGLSDRKARLKEMLFGETIAQDAVITDDMDDLDLPETEEETQKPSRKDRIRDILSENRINSLKKVDE